MADGDNLIIGAGNQGDASTTLGRSGTQTNIAFNVSNSNGSGIHSETIDQNPNSCGVIGESANGIGILANGQTGLRSRGFQGNGVETNSDDGFGLLARSKNSTGVQATGKKFGVEAFSTGRDEAAGVRGTATHGVEGFGTEIGVLGKVNRSGPSPQSIFVGVVGQSNSGHGVFGQSDAPRIPGLTVGGVTGLAKQFGVAGESTDAKGFGVVGFSSVGSGIAGYSRMGLAGWFKGAVAVMGDFAVIGGGKAAAIEDSSGKYRQMYSVESPESWLEDFGSARLVRGRVRVRLKPDFAQFIAREYHVFLTPEGNCNGLYVERKTRTGFDVCEQQTGRGGIRFSYRIAARRRDLQGRRLEEFKLAKDLLEAPAKIRAPRIPETPAELKTLLTAQKKKGAQKR